MKHKIIIMLLILLIGAPQTIFSSNESDKIKYSIRTKGSGSIFWGTIIVPSQDVIVNLGELNYVSNLTRGGISMKGSSHDFRFESGSGEDRYWMESTKTSGSVNAVWDDHRIQLRFKNRDNEGAYLIRPGFEILIIGTDIDLIDLEDLFNPMNAELEFRGKLDQDHIWGNLYFFSGYSLEPGMEFQFVFVNIWIGNLDVFVSIVWFQSLSETPISLYLFDQTFYIPIARKVKIRIKL